MSAVIFNGKFSKLLTSRGILNSNGQIVENDGPYNYVAGNFEQGITGTGAWSLATAGALSSGIPSGSLTLSAASLALTQETSAPLLGQGSLRVAGASAWTAAQGIASPVFTVQTAHLAKVLTVRFAASQVLGTFNNSGTLGSQTLAIWVYDVTASAWIQPAGSLGFNQSSGVGYVTATFQTSSTANQQYQIVILNTGATIATPAAALFDDIYVGPGVAALGSADTDWQAYTPTISAGFGTPGTILFYWRRLGPDLLVRGEFNSGTTAASVAQVSLPAGLSVSSAPLDLSSNSVVVGRFTCQRSGATQIKTGVVLATSTNANAVTFGIDDYTTAANPITNQNGTVVANSGFLFQMTFSVPIAGWSTNVQVSSDTDTRVVAFNASTATGTLTSSFSDLKFTGVALDTHAGYSAATGIYTIPVSGVYLISAAVEVTGTTVATATEGIRLVVAGGSVGGDNNLAPTSTVPADYSASVAQYLTAGTQVKVQAQSARGTPTLSVTASVSNFSVTRMCGPSVVAATESVNMSYQNSAATSITNSGADINVPFATKMFDSHNAYNTGTGIYTVPVSGKYRISGTVSFQSSVYAVANIVQASIYKNAAVVVYGASVPVQTTTAVIVGSSASTTINCNAGDTLEFRVVNNRTAGATLLVAAATANHVEIERVGN